MQLLLQTKSVTKVSPEKTPKPIEIPSALWAPMELMNLVLDGGPDSPREGKIFMDESAEP